VQASHYGGTSMFDIFFLALGVGFFTLTLLLAKLLARV
jgi:hypothetical protein